MPALPDVPALFSPLRYSQNAGPPLSRLPVTYVPASGTTAVPADCRTALFWTPVLLSRPWEEIYPFHFSSLTALPPPKVFLLLSEVLFPSLYLLHNRQFHPFHRNYSLSSSLPADMPGEVHLLQYRYYWHRSCRLPLLPHRSYNTPMPFRSDADTSHCFCIHLTDPESNNMFHFLDRSFLFPSRIRRVLTVTFPAYACRIPDYTALFLLLPADPRYTLFLLFWSRSLHCSYIFHVFLPGFFFLPVPLRTGFPPGSG